MNQWELDILNLENRILQNRKALNDIIYLNQSSIENDELMDAKMKNMQSELDYIQNQMTLLIKRQNVDIPLMKSTPEQREVVLQPSNPKQNMTGQQPPMIPDQNVVSQQSSVITDQNVVKQQPSIMPDQNVVKQAPQNATKQKDFENMIGKSWMGAIASILIFISIIMFATLLLPVLTDALKMTAMFTISIAAAVIGLVKLKKDEKNLFYRAVSGCGIGAIYISLLLSNVYFKALNDIALYILILVWAAFVSVLSRKRNMLFQFIGQSGILISVILGCVLCIISGDGTKFIILTLFFIVSSLIFMMVNYQKPFSANLTSLVFNHINAWVILWACTLVRDPIATLVSGALMLIYIAFSIGLCFQTEVNMNYVFGIINVLNLYQFIQYMTLCVENEMISSLFMLGASIVTIAFAEWKFQEKYKVDKRILQIFAIIIMFCAIVGFDGMAGTAGVILASVALLVWGYYRKDKSYQFGSATFMVYCLFADLNFVLFVLCVLYFACFLTLSIRQKDQYNCVLKIYEYIVAVFIVCRSSELLADMSISSDAKRMIPFMAISVMNLIVMKGMGTKNYLTGQREKASEIVTNVINGILMLIVLNNIQGMEHVVWNVIAILFAVMLFTANSGNWLKRYQTQKLEMQVGIYIGIKFTVLLITILTSYDVANVVISVVCFLFAIACIVVGFMLAFKSLRIYGLILSLISVVKLIMIDVNYDNMIGRAFGFFICGILCFVISLIYNTIDKKIKRNMNE